MVRYQSTRGGVRNLPFEEAVLTGLASDNGLMVPESFDVVPDEVLNKWKNLNYQELAFEVMSLFIDPDEISRNDLKMLIGKSYNAKNFRHSEIVPVIHIGNDNLYMMEMFHGPTFAFKDIALQFLGNLFQYFLERKADAKPITIVGATSGDTGSAAIYGLRGMKKIEIFVMYPHGKVSQIQERQMTTVLDDNVHNIAIEGTFDDCQSIVKGLFGDSSFKSKYNIGAVNSINWARILAQIVYYVYAYFRVVEQNPGKRVSFSVPTGNFGDILAGFYAQKLGIPIESLIVATNENDILHRFFTTGKYHRKDIIHTAAPSMDICVSSNFERYLFALCGEDSNVLKGWMEEFESTGTLTISGELLKKAQKQMKSASVCKDEVYSIIRDMYEENNYIVDPHSAIGVGAAKKVGGTETPIVVVGTASAGKFLPVVQEAIGDLSNTKQHPILEKLMDLPTRYDVLPNDFQGIKEYIANTLQTKRNKLALLPDSSYLQFGVAIGVVCVAAMTIHRMAYS